jgi:hypothetical protein
MTLRLPKIRFLVLYGFTLGTDYTACVIDKMKTQGKSATEIATTRHDMDVMASYYAIWPGLIGITFIEIFPIGLSVALISALLLKKKQLLAD